MTDRAWWTAILVTLVLVAVASAWTAGSTGPARWAVAALLLAAALVLALLDQAARNRARRRAMAARRRTRGSMSTDGEGQ